MKNTCKDCQEIEATTIAGQGFTQFTCPACKSVCNHNNTNVPIYCDKCAKALKVCRYCCNSM